jgi:hypothetical protein
MNDGAQFLAIDPEGVTTTISNCARCKGIHKDIIFKPLAGETIGVYTHWAMCPETKMPIVLQVLDPSEAKFAEVAWAPDDVQSIRPDWSIEKCVDFLSKFEINIGDRITELGWDVLGTLAMVYETEVKNRKES